MRRLLLTWGVLLVLAFSNGTLREFLLKPWLGEAVAHYLSVATAIGFFTLAVSLLWPWIKIRSVAQAASAGLLWLVLTAAFETVVLNLWVGGMSWGEILHTYNIAAGELWGIVLIWTAALPVVIYSVRGPAT